MINSIAMIPFRGLDGKSRLSKSLGGPLDDRSRKEFLVNLLMYIFHTINDSGLFNKVIVLIGKNAPIKYLKSLGLPILIAEGDNINSQLDYVANITANHYEALFIFASDLVFLNTSYILNVYKVAQNETKSKSGSIILGVSRRPGCATMVQIPPGVIPFDLIGEKNLIRHIKIAEDNNIKTKLIFSFEGYFDIDEPEDLIEASYLSTKFPFPSSQIGQQLKRFLVKINKITFLSKQLRM